MEVWIVVKVVGLNVMFDVVVEYLMDEGFEFLFEEGNFFVLFGNCVLVEMSFIFVLLKLEYYFFWL